jgi:transcriptional regulator with XRE-family HTH domain
MLRVKYERLKRNWNQTTLAFHSGLSVPEVSRIETGRLRPYPGQLARLADTLGVTGDALLQEVNADVRPVSE